MKIPLPGMMRHWREREFERHLSPAGPGIAISRARGPTFMAQWKARPRKNAGNG
jgi:hypothetical protein